MSLSDYAGQRLALYFYPRDNTPGCKAQACSLRDGWGALASAGVAVVGVSPDSVKSHEKFAAQHSLPFPLIADPAKKILRAYGAWGKRNLYGRIFDGVLRTTFLIDGNGIIVKIFRRPDTKAHSAQVLAGFGL